MADPENEGQFGNREDTEEQAQKGGEASTGSFGGDNSVDPGEAGTEDGDSDDTDEDDESYVTEEE